MLLHNFWFAELIRVSHGIVFDVCDESVNILICVFAILTFIAHLIMVQLYILIALILRLVDPVVFLLLNLLGFNSSRAIASFLAFEVLSIALVPSRVDFTVQFFDVGGLSCGPISILCSV
jgi:hypothetical protein